MPSTEIVGNLTKQTGVLAAVLTLDARINPQIRAAADTDLPPDHAPAVIGLLPGDTDDYIVTTGGLKGQRGFFTRDHPGTIVGVDLAGRLFNQMPTISE